MGAGEGKVEGAVVGGAGRPSVSQELSSAETFIRSDTQNLSAPLVRLDSSRRVVTLINVSSAPGKLMTPEMLDDFLLPCAGSGQYTRDLDVWKC